MRVKSESRSPTPPPPQQTDDFDDLLTAQSPAKKKKKLSHPSPATSTPLPKRVEPSTSRAAAPVPAGSHRHRAAPPSGPFAAPPPPTAPGHVTRTRKAEPEAAQALRRRSVGAEGLIKLGRSGEVVPLGANLAKPGRSQSTAEEDTAKQRSKVKLASPDKKGTSKSPPKPKAVQRLPVSESQPSQDGYSAKRPTKRNLDPSARSSPQAPPSPARPHPISKQGSPELAALQDSNEDLIIPLASTSTSTSSARLPSPTSLPPRPPTIEQFLALLPLPLSHIYPSFQKLGCTSPKDLLVLSDDSEIGQRSREAFLGILEEEQQQRADKGGGMSKWERIVLEQGLRKIGEDYRAAK